MLGGKIKELRLKHSLTQAEMSAKLGIAQTNIASWENDRTMPSHDNVIKICVLFGISIDSLFDFHIEAADIWSEFIKLNDEHKKMIYTMIKAFTRLEADEETD